MGMGRPIVNHNESAVYKRNWMRTYRAKVPKPPRPLLMTHNAIYQRNREWAKRWQPLWAAWDAVKEYGEQHTTQLIYHH